MKLHFLAIITCSVSLTACMMDSENSHNYDPYSTRPSSMLYPEGYENPLDSTNIYDNTPRPHTYTLPNDTTKTSARVVVPESYHVNQIHGPIPVQDVDRSWVSQQNPNHYTIELARDQQASEVASILAKAPKQARTAEVQSNSHGKSYYTGVYGSFANQEEATAAFNNLPDNLKQKARIETWNQVQN